MEKRLNDLKEREKELHCMYRVHEALKHEQLHLRDMLKKAADQIPAGWRYPGLCMVKITLEDLTITTDHFFETIICQSADIVVDDNMVGTITVYYSQQPSDSENAFLPEEQHLLNNIAGQFAQAVFIRRLRNTVHYIDAASDKQTDTAFLLKPDSDQHWRWRNKKIRKVVELTDFAYYGIQHVYLIGSVKEANAGPKSDIDLIVHFIGDNEQRSMLKEWMAGWGYALSEYNYEHTGYKVVGSLIDLHILTTKEIREKSNSYAAMVGSLHNSARLIQ